MLGQIAPPVKDIVYNSFAIAFAPPVFDTPSMEQRRADSIAEDLEQMILTGVFQDGDRLNELKLAEHFGSSRTPVREAFHKLATAGMVEQIPRRGVFVRHPGPVELMAMFEYMAELEAACCGLAARRITDDALAALSAANEVCAEAVEANDVDRYYAENEAFHRIIYAETRNSFLEAEVLALQKRLKPFRRMQLQSRGRPAQSLSEHQRIVDALAKAESERAARAMRAHVGIQGEKFQDLLTGLQSVAE